MLRKDAQLLVEFGNINMYLKAMEMLDVAFPNAQRLTDSTCKIVLNTEEEVTYFRLIAANLK
jgi:hypothetical protein